MEQGCQANGRGRAALKVGPATVAILMLCLGSAGSAWAEDAPGVAPPAKLAIAPVNLPPELFAVPADVPAPAPRAAAPAPPASVAKASYSAALMTRQPRERSRAGAWLAAGTRKTPDVSAPAHGSSERERAVVVRIKLPF